MHIILDFDGTITTRDTIQTLASFGVASQANRGLELGKAWDNVVAKYSKDYQEYMDGLRTPRELNPSLSSIVSSIRNIRSIELKSLQRVEASRVFEGLSEDALFAAGVETVQNGAVELRKGFREFVSSVYLEGWTLSVISVNWSRSFLRGILSDDRIRVVANEIASDGSIIGPSVKASSDDGPMVSCLDKVVALQSILRRSGENDECCVYFGDSQTDIECLLVNRGIILSQNADCDLIKALSRAGQKVTRIADCQTDDRLCWAPTFTEILESKYWTLLRERQQDNLTT
jgi:thiamine phosphate phosphatase / amino-HMP aminohydrolase